jgi:hypothetical protein
MSSHSSQRERLLETVLQASRENSTMAVFAVVCVWMELSGLEEVVKLIQHNQLWHIRSGSSGMGCELVTA